MMLLLYESNCYAFMKDLEEEWIKAMLKLSLDNNRRECTYCISLFI